MYAKIIDDARNLGMIGSRDGGKIAIGGNYQRFLTIEVDDEAAAVIHNFVVTVMDPQVQKEYFPKDD